MNNNFSHYQGLLFLALAQSMVGMNIIISKQLLTVMPFIFVLLVRFSLAVVIILPLFWISNNNQLNISSYLKKLNLKDWLFLLGQALSAGVIFNCFMLSGLYYTDANIAGIITSALPAIIVLLSWIFLQEKISGKKILCILFAVAGLIIVAIGEMPSAGDLRHSMGGDLLIFISLFPEAAYYILYRFHQAPLPIFLTAAVLNFLNAIFLIPVLFFIPLEFHAFTTVDWIILVTLSVSSGLFYIFWFFGFQRVDLIMASLSTAIMPVVTVVLAYVFLGEDLTLIECAGMLLVLFSIFLYARPS